MGPLAATAIVAFAGISPVGPVAVNSPQSVDPGTELVAQVAQPRPAITLQWNTLGVLSHTLTTPSGDRYAAWFDLPEDPLTDISHAPLVTWEPRGLLLREATAERAHPFSGNPAIEPRPTDDPPPSEPIELLWLVVFGSLIVGGIVAVQRRFSARSG